MSPGWIVGSPPVTITLRFPSFPSAHRISDAVSCIFSSLCVSHQLHARLQDEKRTNVAGRPTLRPSPCSEEKIACSR